MVAQGFNLVSTATNHALDRWGDGIRASKEFWKSQEGVVEDGRMYGVGALDMKGGDAAILLALQAFARDCGEDFCGKIIYHFVSDEEGPYGLGTVFLIADDIDGIRSGADLAIIAEP